MIMSSIKTILVIGGTGAQGVPVVKELARDGKYIVKVLTRDGRSSASLELAASSNVKIIEGNAFDEETLRTAFHEVDATFINTNGFAIGEKSEVYWGIRMYEIAAGAGVQHFVWSAIDYASKLGGFRPEFHTGHADGKGRVGEFIRSQPTSPMAWTIITSTVYAETLGEMIRPFPDPKDPSVMVFAVPLGDTEMPLIALEDQGKYTRWVFDNVDGVLSSNGMSLKISTEHIKWADLVRVFTEVTGQKAIYRDVTLDEYFKLGIFPNPDAKVGHSVDKTDNTLMTYRQNFSGFWTMWKSGLVERDYDLLDKILPGRIKSIKEWMIKTGYTGKPTSVLKDYRDRSKTA